MFAEKKEIRQSVLSNSTRMFLPYFAVVCGMVFALLCVVPTGFAEESAAENFAFAQKKSATPKKTPTKSKPTPTPKNSKSKPTPTPAKSKAKATPTPNKSKAKAKTTPTPSKGKTKPTPTPKKADAKKASAKATPKPKSTPKPTAKSTPRPKRTPEKTPEKTPSAPNIPVTRFLVTENDAVVRSAPRLSASEQTRLGIGTIVKADDRTANAENIGGKSGYWYQITPPKSKKGWTFGGNLTELTDADAEETIRRVVARFSNVERTTFEQQVQLYEFITRVLPEVKNDAFAAELGLTRLLALKTSLRLIPLDRANFKPYSDWTRLQQANVVYNEPAGAWLVRSPMFWDLHKKYRNVETVAERIAWAAAENPLPGECEGYINCYIYFLRATQGEYLENYPNGAHAGEALKNIADGLAPIVADIKEKAIFTAPTDVSDRAEFYKLISELRTSISRTTLENKRAVLEQLNQVAEAYR